jgi:HdeA/HdeB family protein
MHQASDAHETRIDGCDSGHAVGHGSGAGPEAAVRSLDHDLEYDKDNLAIMLMWLDGYYADEDAPPIVDFDKMAENSKKLGEYCGKNPSHSVITAADKVMGEGK